LKHKTKLAKESAFQITSGLFTEKSILLTRYFYPNKLWEVLENLKLKEQTALAREAMFFSCRYKVALDHIPVYP